MVKYFSITMALCAPKPPRGSAELIIGHWQFGLFDCTFILKPNSHLRKYVDKIKQVLNY